jgi:hypothetical protein
MKRNLLDEYTKTMYPIKSFQKIGDADVIYLLYNPLSNRYKIGITTNMRERMMSIIAASGMKEILFCCAVQLEQGYDESARSIESFLHKFYRSKRHAGEWFELNKKDLVELRSLAFEIYGWDMIDGFYDLNCGGFNKKYGINQFNNIYPLLGINNETQLEKILKNERNTFANIR